MMTQFDAILIPGGGLTPNGNLPPWTVARLDQAISLREKSRWFALLSGGTVHKPPPLNEMGFPIFESRQAAEYLLDAGLDPKQILTEICSYDTIGNAYYSRLLFTEPLQLKKLLIITSNFHMPRTREIFKWIFQLQPSLIEYQLVFESTPDYGLSQQALTARVQREKNSLAYLKSKIREIRTLNEFLFWLYSEHTAYTPNRPHKPISENELKSY